MWRRLVSNHFLCFVSYYYFFIKATSCRVLRVSSNQSFVLNPISVNDRIRSAVSWELWKQQLLWKFQIFTARTILITNKIRLRSVLWQSGSSTSMYLPIIRFAFILTFWSHHKHLRRQLLGQRLLLGNRCCTQRKSTLPGIPVTTHI